MSHTASSLLTEWGWPSWSTGQQEMCSGNKAMMLGFLKNIRPSTGTMEYIEYLLFNIFNLCPSIAVHPKQNHSFRDPISVSIFNETHVTAIGLGPFGEGEYLLFELVLSCILNNLEKCLSAAGIVSVQLKLSPANGYHILPQLSFQLR